MTLKAYVALDADRSSTCWLRQCRLSPELANLEASRYLILMAGQSLNRIRGWFSLLSQSPRFKTWHR